LTLGGVFDNLDLAVLDDPQSIGGIAFDEHNGVLGKSAEPEFLGKRSNLFGRQWHKQRHVLECGKSIGHRTSNA
jgi:hypothetical protein